MPSRVFERLAAIGSGPIVVGEPGLEGGLAHRLAPLMAVCNGFYAYESALHVFPSQPTPAERSIAEWNAPDLWRHEFSELDSDCCFFAEDAFGGQFAFINDGVSTFDPETGIFERVADTLAGWAEAILDDYALLTGFPLAHDWQVSNGSLSVGRRLVPRIPFALGGGFEVENLYDADALSAMQYRGTLASQIRDLPDGSSITLRVVE